MEKKYTILVNSCDAYDDLWFPFFTLLKKYWNPLNVRVILNTETKDYHMDGLSIECIHPKNKNASYGERMLNVLHEIDTPYVIPLLDDFFLRKPVDHEMIEKIIDWMNKDKSIVYFNCDDTPVYEEWEQNKFSGFHRIPRGNVYTLNMQAAVWRTDKLISYWKPDVSPWDWEEFCNLMAARKRDEKFYCVSKYGAGFCDYGYKLSGMGVHRGRWVYEDVVPFFEEEQIKVDYTRRGFLQKEENSAPVTFMRESLKNIPTNSELINRCLEPQDRVLYYFFVKFNRVLAQYTYMPELQYVHFSLLKERRRFYRAKRNHERIIRIKKEGLFRGFLERITRK